MIVAHYLFGSDLIQIRIDYHKVMFAVETQGAIESNIDGLKLSKQGVEKEFPDLVGRDDWREEAINRFKENIKSLKGEKAILRYITKELQNHGYTLKRYAQNGYREVKV